MHQLIVVIWRTADRKERSPPEIAPVDFALARDRRDRLLAYDTDEEERLLGLGRSRRKLSHELKVSRAKAETLQREIQRLEHANAPRRVGGLLLIPSPGVRASLTQARQELRETEKRCSTLARKIKEIFHQLDLIHEQRRRIHALFLQQTQDGRPAQTTAAGAPHKSRQRIESHHAPVVIESYEVRIFIKSHNVLVVYAPRV